MDKLIIKGMNPIKGEVSVSGAKNAVLPMLCASVMVSEGFVTIKNVPHLHDVTTTVRLLNQMGVTVTMDEEMNIELDASTMNNFIPLPSTLLAALFIRKETSGQTILFSSFWFLTEENTISDNLFRSR